MGSRSDLHCWEIMQCENPENCPAKKNPSLPCWEIANKAEDYRMANNICRDCIVYVLKAGRSILTEKEIKRIMEKKSHYRIANRYPKLSA